RLQLAVEALGRDRRAEPPPPHHRPRVRRRLLPDAPQIRQRIAALRGGERHGREQHGREAPPPTAPRMSHLAPLLPLASAICLPQTRGSVQREQEDGIVCRYGWSAYAPP